MNTKVLAATLALLAGGPLVTSASAGEPTRAGDVALACPGTTLPSGICLPAGQSARPRFIGPYEVRHGLLPNGLTPNPFTYG